MNGVELTSPEFAYLLATLDCRAIIGLEDPALFPSNPSGMGKTFKNGRMALEQNGWLKPIQGRSEEYELDALLLEAVSVVAAPESVVASSFSEDGGTSEMLLHFLAAGEIVELTAPEKSEYWLSLLESPEVIFGQTAKLMQLEESSDGPEEAIDQKNLEKVNKLVDKGKLEQALKALEPTGLDEAARQSYIAALESTPRGSLVMVRVEDGEITSGRRFNLFGSGSTAWMTFMSSPESSEAIIRPCSEQAVGDFINTFLE